MTTSATAAQGERKVAFIAAPASLLAFFLLALFSLALPTPVEAAPAVDGEFAVSGKPGQIALGPDGNVWVLIEGPVNELARVEPDGTVTEFDVNLLSGAVGITAGSDGNLWFTKAGAVVKVDPVAPASADATGITDISDPRRITTGPDGMLWTASGDKLIRIPPAAPNTFTTFTLPGSGARGIASAHGLLWIADFAGGRLVSVTPDLSTVTPYDVGAGTGPQEVAGGPDGQVAYTNPGAFPHEIGRLAIGATAQSLTVPGTDPFGIAFGADGAYWIALFTSDSLGRLTPEGEYSTLPGLSPGAGARWITAGPNNTLWVSLETAAKVARVSGVEPPAQQPAGGDEGPTSGLATPPRGLKVANRIRRALAVAPRRVTKGGQISFRLAEAGRFRIRFERVLPGKKSGGRCVKPKPALRGRKSCKRFVAVKATITMNGVAGLNRVRFQGRINRRVVLAPGRYRLSVIALGRGGRASAPARANFRLLRR